MLDKKQLRAKWPARLPMTLGVIGFLILVGGFGGWATFSKIEGAVISSGRIEVDQNRQVVQHRYGGIVSEILVDEGDRVDAGQTLIKLDPTELNSQLSIIESELFELMARRARLESERDSESEIDFPKELLDRSNTDPEVAELVRGQTNLIKARSETDRQEIDQLNRQGEQLADQIEGIIAQSDAIRSQLSLIQSELESQQALFDKGLAQASRLLALQREQARLSGTLGELTARRAQAEARITEVEIEALKLGASRREEAITQLRDLRIRELSLTEQRNALREQLSRLDITAPVSGIVYNLRVYAPRSVIQPADPLLFLVPQDRPLIITTQVSPLHVDKVFVGQGVWLKFPAFDQRETPDLAGHVTKLSADAFADEQTGATFYRAEVALDDGEITKLPSNAALLPGMPVEAFIRTEKRTPIAYLLQPFIVYFDKALRES